MYELDVKDLIPSEVLGMLNEDSVRQVVADIAEGARAFLIKRAGEELTTSRNDYIQSILPVEHQPQMSVITLAGQPANIIEQGSGRVDMRTWLLGPKVPVGSPGKKRSKDGNFYRAIPFRHGTPGTKGQVGRAMGDPYAGVVKNSDRLGKRVYNEAKRLGPRQRLRTGTAPKLKAHHKTDIYAGMQKLRKKYEKATQSQYMTWRTISTKNPVGWIRPPTPGKHLMKEAADFVGTIAPQAFDAYVKNLTP